MPQPSNKLSVDNLITYPLIDLIANKNMIPNVITIINIIPSCISLYYLYNKNFILFYIFLIIHIILDCLDGHVARKYNKQTYIGGILDAVTDFLYYSAMIIILTHTNKLFMTICLILLILLDICRPQYIFNLIQDNTLVSVPLIAGLLMITNIK